MWHMFDDGDETMRQRSNVARASRTWQANGSVFSFNLRGIKVPETVYLCGAEKTQIDSTGLQQAHHAYHVQTLGRMQQVRRIGHGVNQFRSRLGANDSVLKQSNAIGSMGLFGHNKGNQGQAHANKNNFSIANLA